ncbi:hypothetical protein [Olleya sp. HaHaR_3_96]|uniref:hypothetical protein n=1 Tax=Olleya sp. HaHaR_3_96 TaxID=2745560 RepID=UPI001C4EC225|nr:hypothetical protein [Olleya sp. HaHaR_3_96]QXP61555.1 hypothetical protein H0I26_07975 [Olleya sp. HaHaR_3_96]
MSFQNKTVKLISPNKSFGAITASISEKELIEIYGQKNVIKDSIATGEGQFEFGKKLFPNSIDEVTITWKNKKDRVHPKLVEIKGEKTNWKTKEGITLGTDLKTLEKLNKDSFCLLGFGWDYQGTITNWNNGTLNKTVTLKNGFFIRLENSHFKGILTTEESQEIYGDKDIRSSNKTMQKTNPKVAIIVMNFQ